VGVVLSGGGARAAYEVGVLKSLYRGSCPAAKGQNAPEVFCGTGAGAFNAAVIASRIPEQQPSPVGYLESLWADEIPREGLSRNNRVFRRRLDTAQFFDFGYMWRRPFKSWVQYFRDFGRLAPELLRRTGKAIGRGNFSSWLDISIITACAPVVFVAKAEIARWPFFGLLAKLQRTVFVERDRRQKTGAVNAEIAQRLAEGDPVLLFGEGTAGDGNRVMPFRSALIGAARDAIAASEHVSQVWIQPVSLAYVSQHGIPFGRHLRPRAAWYGKTSLVPHLKRVARQGAIDVVVTWGEPIRYDADTDRKILTKLLESSVRGYTIAALRGAIAASRKVA